MIAKLTGVLDSTGEDWVVIDTNGVGYLIFCSTRTLINFPSCGEIVSLIIETHIREDHIHLYGFIDQAERDWFRLLTSVQGVGAKVGLGILSVLSPAELSDAILSEDKGMITRAPGVGPKLATRLLSELKDKTGGLPTSAFPSETASAATGKGASSAAFDDAVSALVNLGYQRSAAFSAVSSAINTSSEAAPVEDLIRAGLRELTDDCDRAVATDFSEGDHSESMSGRSCSMISLGSLRSAKISMFSLKLPGIAARQWIMSCFWTSCLGKTTLAQIVARELSVGFRRLRSSNFQSWGPRRNPNQP